MTSLPLSLSTRQSVSPGPRIIVTLTGFYVGQSLILIKKIFFFLFLNFFFLALWHVGILVPWPGTEPTPPIVEASPVISFMLLFH